MKQFAGLKHRADGIFGYQLESGVYRIVLQAPKNEYFNVQVLWDDPYNWQSIKGDFKWMCGNKQDHFKKESDAIYDYFSFELDSREKRFKYFFVFKYKDNVYAYGEFGIKKYDGNNYNFNYHGFAFTWNYSSIGKFIGPQKWWNETSWYQVFPDRFNSDKKNIERTTEEYDENMGGNINGIIQKLDYIKELGFNGIYLNPIFKAFSAHKYDTENYFEIDSQFGTMDDFDNLIKEVKKRNMRIMLDGVFNHCGFTFDKWQDVLKNKEKSKYKDWFVIWNIDQVGNPEQFKNTDFMVSGKSKSFSTFGNTPTMPRFNWHNQDVQDFICDVISFWTKKGIDAWRMDVADEVSFEMWRKVRTTFEKINPNGMLLGEIWYDSMIFLHGDQFDSTMNYPFRNNAFNYFVEEKIDEKSFVESNIEHKYRYPETMNKGLFNLVGSHDTPRIFEEMKQNSKKTKMILAWLLLSDGVISFYYGDEINLIGKSKRYNREPFNWRSNENHDTYKFVKQIMEFRNNNIDILKSDYELSYDQVNKSISLIYHHQGKELTLYFDKKNNLIKIGKQSIYL